jgi:hypothetical protein
MQVAYVDNIYIYFYVSPPLCVFVGGIVPGLTQTHAVTSHPDSHRSE